MSDFLLVFRNDYERPELFQSPDKMQALMNKWTDWMGGLAAHNHLADKGNRLGTKGKTLGPGNLITDGPFAETKEIIGGYILLRAADLEQASELARGCPILGTGGTVEVHPVVDISGNE